MSYDLRIAVKVDGCDKFAEIAEPEYSSPTYNLGKMFRACTGWDYKQGEYYKCSDVIGNIEKGNPFWRVLSWADILKPDVPEDIKPKLAVYFGQEVKWEDGKWNRRADHM